MFIKNKYPGLYQTFFHLHIAYSHFPSSGKILNEGLCDIGESAHAQKSQYNIYSFGISVFKKV